MAKRKQLSIGDINLNDFATMTAEERAAFQKSMMAMSESQSIQKAM